MSIDLLCNWGERMQVTPLRLQVGRVHRGATGSGSALIAAISIGTKQGLHAHDSAAIAIQIKKLPLTLPYKTICDRMTPNKIN